MIVRVISPAPRAVWESLYHADAEAIPYQSPAWFDALCSVAQYKNVSRLYEFANGRQLLLPLVQRKGLPSLFASATSMPSSWGMGGLIGQRPIHPEEIAAVLEDLRKLPYLHISIRPNPRLGDLWDSAAPHHVKRIPRYAHVLDLEGGFDKVWEERFSKQTRRGIRRAEKLGVTVESDTTGRLVPVFYGLLEKSFERWSKKQNEPLLLTRLRGRQRDPLEKFHTISKIMGEACRIWVAWVDGQPAAASVVLQYHNVNDSRGAIDIDLSTPVGANDLLMMHTIKAACEAGCRYYHMGESGNSAGLDLFKTRFGAVGYPYAEYYMERLPITSMDKQMRSLVKRAIGFKD